MIFWPNSSNSFYEKANLQVADLLVGTFCVGLEVSTDRLPSYLMFAQTLTQAICNACGMFEQVNVCYSYAYVLMMLSMFSLENRHRMV